MRYLLAFLFCFFLTFNAFALTQGDVVSDITAPGLDTSGTVDITLDEDEVGLSITANATQTSDLIQLFDSDGTTPLYSINGSGYQFIYNDDFANTDTNYERLALKWDTNEFFITTESGGTGNDRNIEISATGPQLKLFQVNAGTNSGMRVQNGNVQFWNQGVSRWGIDTSFSFEPSSNNSQDLGASDRLIQNIYLGTHVINGGTAPAVSSCGTSPSITGGDTAGKVTIGTGTPSSCTVTFDTAYSNAPSCTISGDDNTNAYGATTTTTALTITSNSEMSGDVIMYQCIGL